MKYPNYKTRAMSMAVILLFFWCAHSLEASPNDAFLNRFAGTWQGDGKAMRMSARLQIRGEWVLGKKFLRLTLKNDMQSATGGSQTFEGHAYYRAAGEGKCEGRWFDSRGASFPINCNIEGESLTALWGTPEQEQGKSVYKFLEEGKLEVVDSIKGKDGSWKEFGRFVVVRQ